MLSKEQLQLFPWKRKGLSTPAGKCRALWGENSPISNLSFGFGVREEERGISMLFSPANTISGGSWQVPAAVPLIPCGHPYSPSQVQTNILACIYLTGKFYFLSLQGIESQKKKKRIKEGGKFFHWEQISFSRVLTK